MEREGEWKEIHTAYFCDLIATVCRSAVSHKYKPTKAHRGKEVTLAPPTKSD